MSYVVTKLFNMQIRKKSFEIFLKELRFLKICNALLNYQGGSLVYIIIQ